MLFGTVGQGLVFLACVYGGLVIGAVYDALGLVRALLGNGYLVTTIADLVFWIGAGVVILFVSVWANDGEIRPYMALGFGVGYALFKVAVSPFLRFCYVKLSPAINRLIERIRATPFIKSMLK